MGNRASTSKKTKAAGAAVSSAAPPSSQSSALKEDGTAGHNATIPHDVIGVVMEFFSPSLPELHQGPARVCVQWHEAFLGHESLWRFFALQRWPKTRRTNLTLDVYRRRRLVEKKMKPAHSANMTEIENCGYEFAFKCPMMAEMLKDTGEGKVPTHPILYCDACDKKVYTCNTREELAENVRAERCVRFNRRIFAEKHKDQYLVTIPYETSEEYENIVQPFLQSVASTNFGRAMVTPTFQPSFVMEVDEPMRYGEIDFQCVQLKKSEKLKYPSKLGIQGIPAVVVLNGIETPELPVAEEGQPEQLLLCQEPGQTPEDFFNKVKNDVVPTSMMEMGEIEPMDQFHGYYDNPIDSDEAKGMWD